MNLIIDEGNTRIKLAVFKDVQLVDLMISNVKDFKEAIDNILGKHDIKSLMISSVTDEVNHIVDDLPVVHKVFLSHETSLPFANLYETPKTLGVDRMALVTGAWSQFPNQNSLVIDAGTCVTYDFINKEGQYLGGAISPGLKMRFKSMSFFTKKLPDLEIPLGTVEIIGKSTKQSMESGVLNGMVFEMVGAIEHYQQKFKDVNIILTGGDANSLCKQLKNSIFVNPNFLLEGLNAVLTYQNKNEAKLK
ncbi:type III pantothenate kinase [Wenyingzhuangia marina]|uniref:Type III pantothenate kinase n=1 Tax=Wenyingzhuangia marina TaxID=1195760 RepID=A0A1M5VZ37_9FLAO|nr:type III pantothenate kinase [Wenyingzhuangia marina]GGF76967.1 type III pantothenate kinase [Wenyingzhuangia marina]SHH80471.1 type III pantothenate kinase [Wenyingzhuangia marina]